MAKTVIKQTPPVGIHQPSADFIKTQFDILIEQKGYRVIIEKALQCPCKSKSVNQSSKCKNCGGSGWCFINPILTRVVLSSMNNNTEYKQWSQENKGTVNISARDVDRFGFMDKITLIDAIGTFTEVRHMSYEPVSNQIFAYTSYNLKEIEYVGLFKSDNEKYQRLELNSDYTFKANVLYLDNKFKSIYDDLNNNGDTISVVVRYKHPPQYFVIDLTRDVMMSWDRTGKKETLIELPVSGIGRRAHYVIDAENLSQTRLLDNSYVIDPCLKDIKIVNDLFDIINC